MTTPRSLADVVAWLEAAPPGTSLAAEALAGWLAPLVDAPPPEAPVALEADPGWRVKLWTVPSETRIGVAELCEAVGRPASWAYRHTSPKSGLPLLPHRKLDGELVFRVGEVRAWLQAHERLVQGGPVAEPRRGGLRAVPAGRKQAS